MDKQKRQFAIREIVTEKHVASQDELRVELKRRGIAVTQATLSRDLRELGVARVSTPEKSYYVLRPAAGPGTLQPIVARQVLAVAANESLIVIRTHPAGANVVAEFIDNLGNPDIIGTLAGDNTLLVIPRSHGKTMQLTGFLRHKLMEGK